MKIIIFLLFFCSLSCSASSGLLKGTSKGSLYIFDRDIDRSSLSDFFDLKKGATIYIDSPGGSTAVAHQISRIIEDKDITAIVYGYCLSACMDIFLAANKKIVLPNAILGMHGESMHAGDVFMLEKCNADTTIRGCSTFEGARIISDSRNIFFKKKGINPELFSFFMNHYAKVPRMHEFDNCDFVPTPENRLNFMKKNRAYTYNGCILAWGEGENKDPSFILPSRIFLEKFGVDGIEYFWYPHNNHQKAAVLKKHKFENEEIIFQNE